MVRARDALDVARRETVGRRRPRGVSREWARKTACSARGSWRLSHEPSVYQALPNCFFDALGLPRLGPDRTQSAEPPDTIPCPVVWQGSAADSRPYADLPAPFL
jgi:hypothetical protein